MQMRSLLLLVLIALAVALPHYSVRAQSDHEEADQHEEAVEGEGEDGADVEGEGQEEDIPEDFQFADDDMSNLNADDMKGEFVQFQVEEAHDTFESNDINEIMGLFAENARGFFNGVEMKDKQAIQATLTPMLELLAHTRYSIISPIHEAKRSAVFARNMYMESLMGCVSMVRSLEEFVFDDSGKIEFIRSEWEQPSSLVMDELNCKADERDKTREDLLPEQQKVSDLVQEMMETYEQQDETEATSFFADDVVTKFNGFPDIAGRDPVKTLLHDSFHQIRNMAITVSSPVFTRDGKTASFLFNEFVVTNTGCSSVFNGVQHITFNDQGKVAVQEWALIGLDYKDFSEWLQQDCGDKESEEQGEAAATEDKEL